MWAADRKDCYFLLLVSGGRTLWVLVRSLHLGDCGQSLQCGIIGIFKGSLGRDETSFKPSGTALYLT